MHNITTSVSDAAMQQKLTRSLHKHKTKMHEIAASSTSDIKYQHYYQMDPKAADQSMQVENDIMSNHKSAANYEWMLNVLKSQEASVKRIFDLTTETRELVAVAANHQGNAAKPALDVSSESILSRLQSEMRAMNFNINIWNGSRTNEAAVDDIVNITNVEQNIPTTQYYLGDDFELKIHINGEEYVYGNRADQECFKDLIGVLHLLRNAQDQYGNINKDEVHKAAEMLDGVPGAFSDMLVKVGNVQNIVMKSIDECNNNIAKLGEVYTSGSLNGMNDEMRALAVIDVADVSRIIKSIVYIKKILDSTNVLDEL